MKVSTILATASLFLAAFFVISSCNRKDDTIAKVFVYDENNDPVSNAEVVLYPEPSESSVGKETIPPDTAITNSSGEAIFNFNDLYQLGQAGVAVLNVHAYKDTLEGYGVIQVVEEETSESEVRIQ
jgi:hypothetical protein